MHKRLDFALLALVSIACCMGVPLIAAAGIGLAVAAWVGGGAAAAVVLGAVVILLTLGPRRRSGRPLPVLAVTRSRS